MDSYIDYETGLTELWGKLRLRTLREYVKKGLIEDPNIEMMAQKMGVLATYQQNCHRMDISMTFERMLNDWFQQELFQLSSSEAGAKLVRILRESHCTNLVVENIQRRSRSSQTN